MTDGKLEAFFDLAYPAHQIDQLPSLGRSASTSASRPTRPPLVDAMYDRLMKGFNAFHEHIYQTHKDRVNGKNDIIEEVAKLLFLESFRLHHDPKDLVFEHDGKKLQLEDVFTAIREGERQRRSPRSSRRSTTSSCTPTTSSPTTRARSTRSSTGTPTCGWRSRATTRPSST